MAGEDPFAETSPPVEPTLAGEDPFATPKAGATPTSEKYSGVGTFARHALHGATAGFSDELTGLGAAAGYAHAAPYLQDYDPNKTLDLYYSERDASRKALEKSGKEHPITSVAGDLTGAVAGMAAIPGLGLPAQGARWLPRVWQAMKSGAKAGSIYGAAEGAGTAKDVGSVPEGVVKGGITGGIGGGLGAGVGEGVLAPAARKAYDYFGRPIVSTVRGLINPENEALRRGTSAVVRGQQAIAKGEDKGLTSAEWLAAKQNGEPVMLADLAGEPGRALMRSAANTSPESRAKITSAVTDRFEDQGERVGLAIRGLSPMGGNKFRTAEDLRAAYDAGRKPLYKMAYQAGDHPVWSPEMERLAGIPAVQSAMKSAITSGANRAGAEGYGAFKPGVTVTPDGQLRFGPGHNSGIPTYPNLQYWDYAYRDLRDAASAAFRAGKKDEGSALSTLSDAMRSELDKLVPAYGNARGFAARYFGTDNALEAGEKAVTFRGDPQELAAVLGKLKPHERPLFEEGYLSALANRMENVPDRNDVTKRIFQSGPDRKRIEAVLGPGRTRALEGLIHRETVYDMARGALGNSTTARQLIEASLAGGAGGGLVGWLGGDSPGLGALAGVAVGRGKLEGWQLAKMGGEKLIGHVDRNVVKKVADFLVADDPQKLAEGLKLLQSNPRAANLMRYLADKTSVFTGAHSAAPLKPSIPSPQMLGLLPAKEKREDREQDPFQRAEGGPVEAPEPPPQDFALQTTPEGYPYYAPPQNAVEGEPTGPMPTFSVSPYGQQGYEPAGGWGGGGPDLARHGPQETSAFTPHELAAERVRRAAHPEAGRSEGKTTKVFDAIGEDLYKAGARPYRIMNAVKEIQPGQPIWERPDIVDAVAQTSLDIMGLPGLAAPNAAVTAPRNVLRAGLKSEAPAAEVTLAERAVPGEIAQLPPNNLPVPYNPKVLPQDIQSFLDVSRAYEAKHGQNWVTKLSPTELSELKSSPALTNALSNIEGAKTAGVFDKVLNAPATRREMFGQAAGIVSAVSNASRLAKAFEMVQPVAADLAPVYQNLMQAPGRYAQLKTELWQQYRSKLEDLAARKGVDLERREWSKSLPEDAKREYAAINKERYDKERALEASWDKDKSSLLQQLNLPKLNQDQELILRSLVSRPVEERGFSWDAGKLPNLNSSSVHYALTPGGAWNEAFEASVKKLTPQQNKEVADHLKPVLTQAEDLSIGDMRNITRVFPSLKGFSLFSGGNKAQTGLSLYSAVERAIGNSTQAKASPEQWVSWLKNQPGIKAEELNWLGLDDAKVLAQEFKGPVTKDELLEHVKGHGPGIKEVEKGANIADTDSIKREAKKLVEQHVEDFYYAEGRLPNTHEREDMFNVAHNQVLGSPEQFGLSIRGPRYGHDPKLQLPGGENYREVLVTIPGKQAQYGNTNKGLDQYAVEQYGRNFEELDPTRQRMLQTEFDKPAYTSSHWPDDPNTLLHMRMNDREIPGVGKSLHLEEVQSDLHQTGRKQGYSSGKPTTYYTVRDGGSGNHYGAYDTRAEAEAMAARYRSPNTQHTVVEKTEPPSGIPNFPFKSSWPDLGLKRAITKAAQEGYSAVSWTPGLQQAERYDLSKHVDQVTYNPKTQFLRASKNGNVLIGKTVSENELDGVVGKDVAKKLLETPLKSDPAVTIGASEHTHQLFGQDLKVGGHGMQSFYDKMLVDKANAIGKKYGAKVEWKELPASKLLEDIDGDQFGVWVRKTYKKEAQYLTSAERRQAYKDFLNEAPGIKVPVLRLTPELKEQALKQGLPLFANQSGKTGAAAAAWEKLPTAEKNSYREQVEAYNTGRPYSEKKLAQLYEDDERLRRADEFGYSREAYHATAAPEPFEEFKHHPDEIGSHFGSVEQAHEALEGNIGTREMSDPRWNKVNKIWSTDKKASETLRQKIVEDTEGLPQRIYPVRLNLKQPLRVEDMGDEWGASNLAWEIQSRPEFASQKAVIDRIMKGKSEPTRIKGLKKFLQDRGYDGLVYKNMYEGLGADSFVTFDPSQVRSQFSPFQRPMDKKNPNLYTGSKNPGSSIILLGNDGQKQDIPRPPTQKDDPTKPQDKNRAAGGRVDASQINHNPTEAQKQSGAYAKDKVYIHGLEITIENAKGSYRSGIGKGGVPWRSKLSAHYGYFNKTESKDGDHVDVYLGPYIRVPHVFVIDQIDPDTGKFDEHKVVCGAAHKANALKIYEDAFSDGKAKARIGGIKELNWGDFKHWLKEGDTMKPIDAFDFRKMPHAKAGYIYSAKGERRCSKCYMYTKPADGGPACTLVALPINPGGTCKHYSPRNG